MLKDRALALRLDHDLSISQIAERLGVSRSTVGGWVRGHGETNILRECLLCRVSFFAGRKDKRFCSSPCRQKHRTFFGNLPR